MRHKDSTGLWSAWSNETDFSTIAGGGETVVLPLPGGVPLEVVRIPAGQLSMGSPDSERGRDSDEAPVHTVTFASGFYIGKFEVTQAQWQAVLGSLPQGNGEGPDYPVHDISWQQAQAFLDAASLALSSSGPTVTVRLPSEAEWEYACRAGTQTRFSFGDSLGAGDGPVDGAAGAMPGMRSDYMHFGATMNSPAGVKPVGQLRPNGFGLFDMHGNVYEYCQDYYHYDYAGAPADGSAWETGASLIWRVIRGGGWASDAADCRSAARGLANPKYGDAETGIRVVVVETPNRAPNRPTAVSPAGNAENVVIEPLLQTSPFSDPDPADTHRETRWQIVEEGGDWNSPFIDEISAAAKTQYQVPNARRLAADRWHLWRAQHIDNHGNTSAWSEPARFKTVYMEPDEIVKVIIVAGSGRGASDIQEQVKSLSGYAFRLSERRGIPRANILTLSGYAFIPWSMFVSNPNIVDETLQDKNTVLDKLDPATGWARDADRLILYFVDHGTRNTSLNPVEYYFHLTETARLKGSELDPALDALQAAYPQMGIGVVFECCYAGGLAEACARTGTQKRIVIASTPKTTEAALGIPMGYISFSYYFLQGAGAGASFYSAFEKARATIKSLAIGGSTPGVQQIPEYDDNGVYDATIKNDGILGRSFYWGSPYAFASSAPIIVSATEGRTLTRKGEAVNLFADLSEGLEIERVWAQIVSPDAANEPDEPITDFIEVDLIREGDSQTWSAVYGDWQTPGLYQVTFMASGNDGHEPPELLLAEPWPIQISLEPAYGAPDVYDLYFNDATAATLNQMLVNNPQAHVISDAADEDWATAIIPDAGWPYSVHVENAASGLDAELSVYLNGPANAPETPEDETGFGGSETFSRLNWPKAGKIWIRVRAAALAEGEPTSYTLVVRRNTGANIVIPIISGTQQWSLIGPQGGELVLRGTGSGRAETGGMDLYDGAAAWPYTKHKVQIPAGATGTQTLPFMLEYPKQYKNDWALYVALQAWNAEPQRANNASVIILCAPDGYCIPSDASFKITCEYQDGSHFGSEVIDDLPDGAEEARMSLYRFLFNADGISGRWEIVPGKHIDFAENTVTAVVRELSCSGNLCFDEIDGQIVEYSYGFFAVAPASARDAEVDSPAWRQYE